MEKLIKVGIIGPRPYFLGGHDINNEIRQNLRQQISSILKKLSNEHGIIVGITGLSAGAEQDFALTCLENKIDYYVFLPYECNDKGKSPPNESMKLYSKLLDHSVDTVILYDGKYSPQKNIDKNLYIIDNSDYLIYVKSKKFDFDKLSLKNKISESNLKTYYIYV